MKKRRINKFSQSEKRVFQTPSNRKIDYSLPQFARSSLALQHTLFPWNTLRFDHFIRGTGIGKFLYSCLSLALRTLLISVPLYSYVSPTLGVIAEVILILFFFAQFPPLTLHEIEAKCSPEEYEKEVLFYNDILFLKKQLRNLPETDPNQRKYRMRLNYLINRWGWIKLVDYYLKRGEADKYHRQIRIWRKYRPRNLVMIYYQSLADVRKTSAWSVEASPRERSSSPRLRVFTTTIAVLTVAALVKSTFKDSDHK